MEISARYFRTSRVWILLAFITYLLLLSVCQTLLAQQPQPSQLSQPTPAQPTHTDTKSEELQRLTDRVGQLESDFAKASKDAQGSSESIALTTAMIAGSATLVAALLAGFLTLVGAYFTAKREERRVALAANQTLELTRQEALFQHGEKFLEFRLKQMGLFYAPMFALLEQSKALRDKMMHQLVNDEPTRYKELPKTDSTMSRFQVCTEDGKWKEFRLLDQLPAVRTNPRAFALVERIIQIGERMTAIISEHAGLASEDLVDLLGEYLAHYEILSMIYKSGENKPYEPGWHKMGYYPRALNEKIEAGYREISAHLNEYEKKTKQVLQAFPEKNSEKGV